MTWQNDTQRAGSDRTGDTVRTDTQRTDQQQRRLNPRLVFTNPDEFFTDLLMEQDEQS